MEQPSPHRTIIKVADGDLHVLDWGGCGTPAHLLHANGFCAGTYATFVRLFTDHLRIIASDVRGHGDSVRFDTIRIRNWKPFAEDLAQVVSATLPLPAVGIGHSLGAVTTLMAAVRHPDLFAGIVLIDPPILPAHLLWYLRIMRWTGLEGMLPLAKGARRRLRVFKNKQAAFARFAAGRGIFKKWAPEFIQAYLDCGLLEKDPQTAVLKCDPELEAQIFESIPTDIWDIVPMTPCPTLVIRGEMSDTLRPEVARRLRRLIKNCRLDIISGTGHFPPMEKPEACAESIIKFVQQRVPPLVECQPPGVKSGEPFFSSTEK